MNVMNGLALMEWTAGIEPASSAWEAEVMPLYDDRFMVPITGIELVTC